MASTLSPNTKVTITLAEFKRFKEIETLYEELKKEKEEVSEDAGHLCENHIGDELDNILFQEEMDWGFYKPTEGKYTKIYIFGRKY